MGKKIYLLKLHLLLWLDMLDQKFSEESMYLVPNEAALNLVEAFKWSYAQFYRTENRFHLASFIKELRVGGEGNVV